MGGKGGRFGEEALTSRRAFLLLGAAGAGLTFSARTASAATDVPIPLQAELVSKAAKYDRNMPKRVDGGELELLSVYAKGDPDSATVATLFRNRIRRIGKVGGFRVKAESIPLFSPEDLADRCRGGAGLVYLASGMASQIPKIAEALTGASVLSVASDPRYVSRGVVLGFDLIGGRPQMLVHLTQARAQNVQLRSSLLKLAEIVG